MTIKHTCQPRSNGLGLFQVEVVQVNPLGRRINVLGPYKSTWNNGCDACLVWKIAQRTEHIIQQFDSVYLAWIDNPDAVRLRGNLENWMCVNFRDTSRRLMLGSANSTYSEDTVKAIAQIVRNGQVYGISRITTSASWRQPKRDPRYDIIKLPCESYAEAKQLLVDAGFESGFARPGMSTSQIEWQLREQFDPGIDLK